MLLITVFEGSWLDLPEQREAINALNTFSKATKEAVFFDCPAFHTILSSKWGNHLPILGAKEDMTEEDAQEFLAFVWSHINPLPDRIIGEITDKEIRLGQSRNTRKGKPYIEWTTMRFDLSGPRGFHWLLLHGFNVFDLEWETEAIRKEAENG